MHKYPLQAAVTLSADILASLSPFIPDHEPILNRQAPRVIWVCEPTLLGNEREYILDCVTSNWISSKGQYITRFEDAFRAFCGTQHAVSCTSGTTALHLAMATLGIGPGDEVIIPTFTMIATANAVRYTGATPILIDAELDTWNIDIDQIASHITSRTKAIIVVHTYGHPVDMDKVNALALQHNLPVIEDAAEAHGAEYKGQRIGGLATAAAFSFYGNKIATTGEGGMIVTDNTEYADLARNLKEHAFSNERHFWHQYVGYNYRMTNIQAAIGLAQVEQLDTLVTRRRHNAALYTEMLQDIEGITTPPENSDVKNVFWMYGILLDHTFGMSRNQLREALAARGIETRTFFIPIHFQPIYYHQYTERYPNAEHLCQWGLYLPSSSNLTESDIQYTTDAIREIRLQTTP